MEVKPSYEDLENQVKQLTEKIQDYEKKFSASNENPSDIAPLTLNMKLLEAAFDQAPFPIVLVGPDGALVAMNKAYSETVDDVDFHQGISGKGKKCLWKYFDSDGKTIFYDQLPLFQALEGKKTKSMEIRVQDDKNRDHWESVTASPVYDADENIVAGCITFPDITNRKRIETKILESEVYYRRLFENAGISIWNQDLSDVYTSLESLRAEGVSDLRSYLSENPEFIWDLVSKIKVTEVNDATLVLFDLNRKKQFFDNVSNYFGEGAITVFTKEIYAIWEKKSHFISEGNLLTSNGEAIRAIITFKIPDKAEDFSSVAISIQNITGFNRLQDQLNAVVEALPDITFILDEDGKYIDVLTSRHDLLYDELQNLEGNLIHNILPEPQADLFLNTIRQVIKEDKKRVVGYELDLPQGKVWFEGRVAPMHTTFKNKKAVVWIAMDVTERKMIEQQLRQAQKMEAIGILTGGIAHEFNNLLTPILGYTDLFLNDMDPSNRLYGGLEQIYKGGVRAKELIQHLLAYSRQSSSKIETVYLLDVVKDTVTLIKNAIPDNIKIKKDIQTNLPAINGMPNELHQMILNLCLNASHALKDGGEILITLDQSDPKQQKSYKEYGNGCGFIHLCISDTGEGMDNYVLEKIFDPFFTTKEVGTGTGLGLSVVQGIVEQHEGVIEVESKVGEGSSFHVYFPIALTEIKPKIVQKGSLLTGSERIMVIDNEQMVLETTMSMLKSQYYEVTGFIESQKALQAYLEQPDNFDLIITDYGMININGKEFTEKIRDFNPDIPIIMITGYGETINEGNVKPWGINVLLKKPFTSMELGQAVRKALKI